MHHDPVAYAFAKVFLVGLLFIGFFVGTWIIALIDIIRSEFQEPNNKIIWIIVLIFLGPLGVLLYVLIGRGQKRKKGIYTINR